MRRLHLDLAAASWQGRWAASAAGGAWAWAVLALVGLVLVLTAWLSHAQAVAERTRLQAQWASRLQASRPVQSRPAAAAAAADPARDEALRKAVQQLNMPWSEMFNALERASGSTVALLALNPDAGRQRIRGQAEARDAEAMTAYIERLKQAGPFSGAWLSKHEGVVEDGDGPLRFEFEITWQGGGR